MAITTLRDLLIKIFLMIAFGFFLRKKNVITDSMKKDLSNLLLTAVLPINVLSSCNNTFSSAMGKNLVISLLITSIYYILTLIFSLAISKKLHLSDAGKRIFVTMSVFANVGFIGFPIISQLYGEEGTLYAVIYNLGYQIFLFTYGISLLSKSKKVDLKGLYKDPVTLLSIAALIIFISPFRFPIIIQETFDAVGNMTVPISMMIIGCDLSNARFSEIFKDKYSYIVSFLRLLIYPIIMACILVNFHLGHVITAVMVIMTALPCGSLNVILSEKYNCEPEFAARTVIQSMVLMILTIPIIVLFLNLIST